MARVAARANFAASLKLFAIASVAGVSTAALAQETTTYDYDALGRVTKATKANGPENGVQSSFTYDKAGNRTNVTVINSPNGSGGGSGNGDGASLPPPQPVFVVVPLNGYTLIRIR